MRRSFRMPALLLFVAAAAVVAAAAQGESDGQYGQDPAPAASAAAVFTEEQAQRGAALYEENCSRCHRSNLLSNDPFPPITGPRFFASWEGRSASELYAFVRESMPLGEGGSLSAEAYADIFAFWLDFHEYPAGETELDAAGEILERIPLVPPVPAEEPESP